MSSEERFLGLLEEHKKILHKVASSYAWTAQDRQDLVQEMAVQLWRSFERYDGRGKFSTWMYRVALNVAISHFRSETTRTRHVVPGEPGLLEFAAARIPGAAAPADPPDDDLRLLHEAMERLDELDRALLILHLDGHRYDTIAEILGISETNVGTKLTRLKHKLRRDLSRAG